MPAPNPLPPKPDFARLLVQHDRSVLRYILTFIPRRDDAEEVLQRTATVLWEKFDEYDAAREFLPWALRVAYFEVLTFRKEAARSRLLFCDDVVEQLAETRETERNVLEAQHSALQECLQELTAESAALLRRRYSDSQTIAELATEWGKSAKSLYRKLDRLRDMIATCVERRLGSRGILETSD